MTNYASYIRVSTDRQEEQNQRDEIIDEMERRGFSDWTEYADIDKSGSDPGREQFLDLKQAVEDDEYDAVVMYEISRLARRHYLSVEFVHQAVETETDIILVNDIVDTITHDDKSSQLVAHFASAIAEHERDMLIQRVKSGIRRAKRQGKWTGQPPMGFQVSDDGYLELDLEEYLTVQTAIERIEDGGSYRSVATEVGLNRVTLMDLHKERKELYLDGEAEDDRVKAAVTDKLGGGS